MNSVDHIPQTLASHIRLPEEGRGRSIPQHGADMLKPDPRDTFYRSKSNSYRFRLSPFFFPHPDFPACHFFSLIDCLAHSLSGCQFSCTQTLGISSGWRFPRSLLVFLLVWSLPWSSPSFLTLTLVQSRIYTYLFFHDLKYSPPLLSFSSLLSSYDRPLPTRKCSTSMSLLSNICCQRFSHRQIPGSAICKSPSLWIRKRPAVISTLPLCFSSGRDWF